MRKIAKELAKQIEYDINFLKVSERNNELIDGYKLALNRLDIWFNEDIKGEFYIKECSIEKD